MIVSNIIGAVFVLQLVVLVHLAGRFTAARLLGMRVDGFSFGIGPALRKWTRSDTEYRLNAIPLFGGVRIAGLERRARSIDAGDPRAFANRSIPARLFVQCAGPLLNLFTAMIFVFAGALLLGIEEPDGRLRVFKTLEDGAAARAGVRAGDRIISAAGVEVHDTAGLGAALATGQGREVMLAIEREHQPLSLPIIPTWDGARYKIGVMARSARAGRVAREAGTPA